MTRPLLTLKDVAPLAKGNRKSSIQERRRRNMQSEKYDLGLLSECERSWMNKENFRQERARVLRYLFGNQWGDIINVKGLGDISEEKLIRMNGNVPLKNNVLISLWSSVFGVHAKQETEPVCYARNQAAKELSDNMSAALQTNWQNTYMSELLDTTFAEYLISGAAFTYEVWEERDEVYDSYTDYQNPYYMFWEGGSDPTHRDIRLIGRLCDMSREDLFYRFAKREYGLTIEELEDIYHLEQGQGGSSTQVNELNDIDNVSFFRPSDINLCRVIEVWRQEIKPRYQCCDPLSADPISKFFRCEKKDLPALRKINLERKAMYDEQGVPEELRGYITAVEIVDKYWQCYYLAPNGRILYEQECPYDYKTHPFSVSLYPYINGEIHPFMSFFIDQQRYINRTVMMGDMAMKNAAKGMTFLPLSMKPDDMTVEEYANQKTKFDAVFVYDDTKPGRSGAKPEFFTHSAMNIGHTEMLQLQMNMLHEVSGVSGALQGKEPNAGTSYARYALEAHNATTTIYPLIKKFNGFEERCAMKKCITMQQYYEEGRDVTPRRAEEQIFFKANASRDVKYNVAIKNSASSAAFLQLGNEMLDKLLDRGYIDPRTYLKHYDAPGVDKILQDVDGYMSQLQQGQIPSQPVQIPGANQERAALASQLMQQPGQLFTRQSPNSPLTRAEAT
ncbi:hypothetical protein L6472_06140 [Prevotella sp. E13-17]|uniref:portal protein n=1 Tax=Prevotella sp. E13-17 TaxID=2913616 RepID=UPI001EDAD96B|nr:hypothetical protein [Prevotella sp. E13-17]UKK52158.1 hypothetical protein L6472_06140 [Prevotella sp. E13-17]